MNVLTVSGSLRASSSNLRALEAVRLLAPRDWIVRMRRPLDEIPFFNPDVEKVSLPEAAREWRSEIAWSDAIIVSSPEYAHGVPGVLKNALDWLVGGIEIIDKPIALFNATPPAEFAHASLRETLRVMGGTVVDDATIELPLRGRSIDVGAIVADAALAERIQQALHLLAARVSAISSQ